MDIVVNYDYRESDVLPLLDIERLARLVIEREGKPASTEVSITFATDDEVHELNRTWRGIDRTTDVLSFECDNLDDGFMVPADDEVPYELGDIVRLKKKHPCGSFNWEILRVGMDFRLKCQGCGHLILIPRTKFEKMVKGKVEEV